MSSKYIRTIVALLVIIAVIVVLGFFFRSRKQEVSPSSSPQFGGGEASTTEILTNLQKNKYVPDIPINAKPTKPKESSPAAPNSKVNLGLFEIQGTKDGFNPSSIIVTSGDLVQMKFTAVDGDYDFSMPYFGLYQFAKKGETKNISFQTTGEGTLLFECKDHCPSKGKIEGQFVVMPTSR